MFALIVILLAINAPWIHAWDSDQMEVFDLVEEMNNINFYQFLDVPEVSTSIHFCIVLHRPQTFFYIGLL